MLVRIPSLLAADELLAVRQLLEAAAWADGRLTAGHQSAAVKSNLQLPHDEPAAREAGEWVVRALERSPAFASAALPRHLYPPLFNRYETGMAFGAHIDNALRQVPGSAHRLRTDVSATLFLTPPDEYDGGELRIEDAFGVQSVKPAAGDLVVYPASSVHRVERVTRGVRLAAIFWVQSLVRDDGARAILYELDASIRELTATGANRDCLVHLTACYHNLLRRWAEL
ncbi:MAG TPA: Fe2+-dependent dioxygenase [Steroidobacteraceae bacterium]|nr:Fe2+-dependent dioxygenase [Steroidobacteraceae bacterium]